MTDLWTLVQATQATGYIQWLVPGLSAVLGAAITAGAVYGAARSDLKDHDRRLESHDERLTEVENKELEERFVTRREFELALEHLRDDISEVQSVQTDISADVKAIRDFLLRNAEDSLDPNRLP